ncbi:MULTISPECIES: polyprenyl synthetase family protein [Streptomyces]|uniref:Polyprenyl synthetase family protein n=1 Tax=Streptomyces tsukubensis (strain DSM 42081 / NBRC 108919 / NRRL 18488 / 9993) TaxID=1114943 RepID=I2N090_STRT9|nr:MULTISPECIES: polyprenyl synthetase family protein [Streptomyces]AZK94643.1 polyprenyl synthetase [Streptomyces tsukubensis]EIF90437.1 polyprenyl synthetase [Streptomyces tsukubensis NRRL18488]MYS65538.1 polyprenyl synthetase family protein [Streptomyces sp. SID5473]QKM69272.1 polyprenyl synthetase family protein [Streptomyces tsukubensis NRRL18488]TAI43012.1 polyprenyl synthetase family protein [Streptomyces tsukubensis]
MTADRYDPGAFKLRVDGALRSFVAGEADRLVAIDPDLAPVAEQVEAAVADGKRLRAAFCYWGWRAAGQPDSDALLLAAASMELVHAAAVVHDDLIDDSPLRHGRPTVHIALRSGLRQRQRTAGAARSLAMLVGDLLISLAGQLFAGSGLPAAYLARARPLWSALARELIAGECLEILRTGTPPDTATSLKVIRYKTAKYTVEQPLLIGGVLGGAGERLRAGFSAYGLPLGEAFQLRDDLLGLFGDPARTGKAAPDDLRTARPTALLAETWRAADASERAELRALLGRGRSLDAAGVDSVRTLMNRLDAPGRIERMITARVEEATRALDEVAVPRPAAAALAALAHSAAVRQF